MIHRLENWRHISRKKITLMFESCGIVWAVLLSINIMMVFLIRQYCLFSFESQSSNIALVIHVLLLDLYSTNFRLMFLKQRGLADFPIINRGNFSLPSIFDPINIVTLCLLWFLPVHFSFLKLKLLSGWNTFVDIEKKGQACQH